MIINEIQIQKNINTEKYLISLIYIHRWIEFPTECDCFERMVNDIQPTYSLCWQSLCVMSEFN